MLLDIAGPLDVLTAENLRLTRRLERERHTRVQAEAIAERGLRDLYDRQLRLEFLGQIATLANQGGPTMGVLTAALALICRFAGWHAAHAYLPAGAATDQRLWPTNIWYEQPGGDLSALRAATAGQIYDRGEGLPGRVWATASPEWIGTLHDASRCPRSVPAQTSGLHAAFAFPLLIETEVVGVLEVFATVAIPEDTALLQVMAQVGTQLGRVLERERAQDRLHDALHDALTGLPNRANFLCRLDQALRDCQRDKRATFTVLFIDLDQFKLVNDSLGHQAGDTLIREVGRRLAATLAKIVPDSSGHPERGALLSRLGGDEFTVLLCSDGDPAQARRVATALHEALAAPVRVGDGDVITSASIGIAFGNASRQAAGSVLRDADLAMYHAKAGGRARTALFDTAMHETAVQRLNLESEMRDALLREEFVLHYQPILRLTTDEVVGFEALVRWRLPSGMLRSPDCFIPVAEETGMIVPLGLWVLREACLTAQRWASLCPADPPHSMSVNLSARQFAQPDLVEQVRKIMADTGIDPATLRLEITETATVEDAERAVATLSALRNLGLRISIDDFGTGFSSLSYLHRFPLHVLKIDRSFVCRMETSRESLQIVRTLLSLARNLGMEVVAEGAETKAEVDRLRALGCDYCQGFYFSPPLPPAEALAYLRRSARPGFRQSARLDVCQSA